MKLSQYISETFLEGKPLIFQRIYPTNPPFFSNSRVIFNYNDIVKAPFQTLVYPWVREVVTWIEKFPFLPVAFDKIYKFLKKKVGD